MGFWDRLLGREEATPQSAPPPTHQLTDDEVAVERYRYLLRTAPAATIEQVHEEAFAKLSPQQRALVFRELGENAAPGEAPISDDPRALARSATRTELRSPGSMERAFSGGTGGATPGSGAAVGGPSFGSMLGSSLLGTIAGYVIGSALVSAFLPPLGTDLSAADDQDNAGQDSGNPDSAGQADAGYDSGSADGPAPDTYSAGGDYSGGDYFGDSGADLGGGDFGDFGF